MTAALAVEIEDEDDALLRLTIHFDRRRQVSDQVYEALKKAIISLRLPPGTLISENRICRQIGVSRTPVRSAITRLVEDALIEVFPQKGSFVAPIKLSAVRNNHFIRKALEIAVLRRAAEAWTPELAARSRQILKGQAAALADEDVDAFHGLDEEFHRSFCAAADLGGVWSTIQIAKARVDRVHRLASELGRLPLVIVEHGAILDALDGATPSGRRATRLSPRSRARDHGEPAIGVSREILRRLERREEDMAKIARVEIRMVDLKPKTKRVDAIQSFVSQETPFVFITDTDGAIGVGYSYTIGTGGPAIVDLIARSLAPALIGREAERGRADLARSPVPHPRDFGRRDHEPGARRDRHGAVGPALQEGGPAAAYHGRRRQERVRLYTTEGGWLHLPKQALVDDALAAKSHGFGGSKVKVGRPYPRGRRDWAVRVAVGADFEILTDANQAFTVDEAIRRARHYEAADIGWFEEPLPADDIDGHVRLSRSTSIPIAVGESLYGLSHFRDYLQRGACSIVQVDVARIGGVTPWLKTAHLAEAYNVAVCPHFLMELHVALCCAAPNSRWLEYIPQLDNLTTEPMRIRDGHAEPSEAPGLGISWDFEAIERLTAEGSRRDLRLP